jgi:hypothetical protein
MKNRAMLVLLSSGKRKRYRDDILRCLAAPCNTFVQFRYAKSIVENQIWNKPATFEGQPAIVCSVDLDVIGKPCPLIPVRLVTVEKIYRHGTTMSILLRMGDLAIAEDIEKFTSEVDEKSATKVPRKHAQNDDAQGSQGYLCFDAGGIGLIKTETTIDVWEQIISQLAEFPGYNSEPFFWTVLSFTEAQGLTTRTSTSVADRDHFRPWDERTRPRRDYVLLVYVFHPKLDRWTPSQSQLRLTAQPEISSSYPLDLTIDSPYDVKEWQFRLLPDDTVGEARGWLKIGPVTPPESPAVPNQGRVGTSPEPGWEIFLPLRIGFPWGKFLASTALIGILLAVPVIIGYWLQNIPTTTKIVASVLATVLGITTATVAGFGIKRKV